MSKTLTIKRVFNAPVELVWQAWTGPEMIKKWWGPANFTAPEARTDFRVGGKYLYCMRGAAGPGQPVRDFWSTGEYKEIVPMQKIVATDNFADADGNVISPNEVGMPGEWTEKMIVTATFEALGNKTKLTLVHTGHPDEMAGPATQGWNQSLDKFAAALA